jgi:hypothetical protein
MKTLCFALTIGFGSPVVLAQVREITMIATSPTLRADPPSSTLDQRFSAGASGRGSLVGQSFLRRYVLDDANHVYFGYELVVEQQQIGTFSATFRPLTPTPSELSKGQLRPLPAMPQPRVVHDGDTISIDLFVDAATGEKLIDDIRIQSQTVRTVAPPPPPPTISFRAAPPINRPVPTVSGTARDFTVTDAELQLTQPRVTLNGTPQSTAGRGAPSVVRGSLVWFYLPNHGRYILSLAARPELDFKVAGEVRGGAITFTLGEDSIKLECPTAITTGSAPYNLYVLHDPEWEPTAQSQKGLYAAGSVDPGELAALNRK